MDVGVMYLASRPATLAIPLRLYQGWLQVYHNVRRLAKLSSPEVSSKHVNFESSSPEKFPKCAPSPRHPRTSLIVEAGTQRMMGYRNMSQSIKIARLTGWIGLAPLLGLPIIAVVPSPDWLNTLLVSWAVILLAFWSGHLWMRHLDDEPPRPWLLIAAFALALVSWPAIVLPLHWAMFWLAALYTVYLFIDEPWRAQGRSGWHRRMRLALTLAAIAMLLAGGLLGSTGGT